MQDALGGIIQVVELPAPDRQNEQHGEHGAEDEGNRQQEKYGVHVVILRTRTSTLEAPQITMALESGMSTAATSGLIHPSTAAVTARTLYPIERNWLTRIARRHARAA